MHCLDARALGTTLLGLVATLALGCPGPTPAGVDANSAPVCVPNTTQVCACPLGVQGAQTCNSDGSGWLECRCGSADGGPGSDHTALIDGARSDAPGTDSGRDAGIGTDTAASDHRQNDRAATDLAPRDQAARDTIGRDTAIVVDGHQPDQAGVDTGCGSACDAGSGVDRRVTTDAFWRVDASGIDTINLAGLGQRCDTQNCVPGTTCLGDSTDGYYCRKDCALGGTDCDVQTERCVWFTYMDGGMAPYGGCEPAVGYNVSCATDFCAEIYICVTPSGAGDWRCRARCLPGALDAGCPVDSPRCARITGTDGGACLPRG